MKTKTRIALILVATLPAALFASSSTDGKIEDAAKASYNYRAVLDNRVMVKSTDGVVTLTGVVQDKDDKDLAEDTVENLPGVVSVINQIEVKSEVPEHSDAWIAVKIRTLLLFHANVSATSTKVDVANGVVLLTGTVDNSAQKDLTEAYAKDVEGVTSVTNDLVVKDHMDKDHPTDSTMGDKVDDASITSQVKFALISHRSTSAIKTKVTTKDGVVMVSGDASNDAEKDLVSKLAGSIRGVKSVDNQMVVKTN